MENICCCAIKSGKINSETDTTNLLNVQVNMFNISTLIKVDTLHFKQSAIQKSISEFCPACCGQGLSTVSLHGGSGSRWRIGSEELQLAPEACWVHAEPSQLICVSFLVHSGGRCQHVTESHVAAKKTKMHYGNGRLEKSKVT